ncbi:MAG: hypothetical protein EBU08_12595 [Micrococcales bacterium]|nr:hypothetical protein [Micrococcales bacterium]
MSTYAVVSDQNKVENVVVWDGESDWTPPPNCSLLEIAEDLCVGIGWTYQDGQFSPSESTPQDPQEVI